MINHKLSFQKRNWRYIIIIGILLLACFGLLWRIVYLTVLNRHFLQTQGDARTLRIVETPAYRGMVLDRHGEPLAISTPVDAVWINPKEFDIKDKKLTELSNILQIPLKKILHKAAKNIEHEFVYLKRGLDPVVAQNVMNLKINGVYLRREYRRFYPEGEVTAHLLGFTNIDDQGQEGLELAFNQWLAGIPGRKRMLRDCLGHMVAEVNTLRNPKPGRDLILSIDRRIQYLAYRELSEGVQKYQAKSGSAIVLDLNTGEILAMVNQPSYNPNNRPTIRDGSYRNRAVTDLFEPGSTIKTFSIISALLSGKYRPDTIVDTSPGWMMVDNKKISDEHIQNKIDLTTILAVSSNVGVAKVTLSLPPDSLWQVLNAVGFGQITDSGFPGESPGVLVREEPWRPFMLATLSFGYGMSSTALQLAQAYSVLGNKGIKKPVSLLKLSDPPAGEKVLDEQIATQVLTMLESVIKNGGTAPLAKVEGYRVTGKTGTSRLLDDKGTYQKTHHNGSFIGMAPASSPRILVAVVLHDPSGAQYYGGYTAGPVFSKIMRGALRILNIAPDNV